MKPAFYLPAVFIGVLCFTTGCNLPASPQWEEIEIVLSAEREYDNPYTDVDVHIVFTGPDGQELKKAGLLGWRQHLEGKVCLSCQPGDMGMGVIRF
jgi:hypothetical protein